jgi:peroxiredoxin
MDTLKTFIIGTAILCFSAVLPASPALALKTGTVAPDFSLTDLHGKKTTLSSHRGEAVILNFWATSCGPCVAELPGLNALFREFKGSGLTVIGVSIDHSDKPVRELVASRRIDYPVVMDSDKDVYFDSYGLFGQPVSVLIDRRGIVAEVIFGQVEWGSPPVKAKIQNLLKRR